MRNSKFLKVTVCIIGALLIFSVVVMLLWNWLIPEIFNGPRISIMQALGLLLLCKVLFTGFGGKGHCQCRKREFWKSRFAEKIKNMSSEEKERLKTKLSGRCFEAFDDPLTTTDKIE